MGRALKSSLPLEQWGVWGIRLLFIFYLLLGALGFARLPAAVDKPFGGFIWLRNDPRGFTVSWEVGRTWAGRQAGLALDDRILRIQGQEIPLDGEPDIVGDVYQQAEVGQRIDYKVERQGRILHIQVPVTRFTWRHLLESYIPFYAASLTVWGIGLFVHLVSPKEWTSNLFALVCLALSATFGVHNFNGFVHKFFYAHWSISIFYGAAWSMLNALAVHFFSIFPEPRDWWPRIRPWVYGLALAIGAVSSTANALWSASQWVASALIVPTLLAMTIYSVVAALYCMAVFIFAYRHSSSTRVRHQVRIVGLGLILGLLLPFLSTSTYILFRPYPGVWWSPTAILGVRPVSDWLLPLPLQLLVTATVFPTFLAVAILRYRAFNAKPAMVKAVATTLLAVALILIYTLAVNGFQALLDVLSVDVLLFDFVGERFEREWIGNILAILVTAILLTPLRDLIQRGVTRLLYPYRITGDEALKRLIEAVRQADRAIETSAEMSQVLTSTLKDMLHLQDVYLWFYFPASGELQLAGSQELQPARLPLDTNVLQHLIQARPPLNLPTDPALAPLSTALARLNVQVCLPLVYRGRELVGLVGLGPRRDEVPFGQEDRQLLFHLAEYLLLLLKNVRTIQALERSRERIGLAQERERRRIAQDLHDGPLQDLSYLATVELELCKRAVPDPEQAVPLIQGAQKDVGRAIADLRGMLSDISPEIVSRRGLVSALRSLVNRARSQAGEQDVEIVLHVAGCTDQMLPEQYELALFRYVQEALSNALKHARAGRIDITLHCTGGRLLVVVQDDGCGFDVGQHGEFLRSGHLGLQSMQDRIESLRGEFSIQSPPGEGTTVQAEIPLPSSDQEAG